MKIGNDDQLEIAVFSWVKQKREERVPVLGKYTGVEFTQLCLLLSICVGPACTSFKADFFL